MCRLLLLFVTAPCRCSGGDNLSALSHIWESAVRSSRTSQSNGIAEAFVKTFKRDYVYIHDRPDAQTVLSQLSAWFEDYNESHPHKALQTNSTPISLESSIRRQPFLPVPSMAATASVAR